MVVAGKIFRLSTLISIAEIVAKLNGYHTADVFEEGDNSFELITEVTQVELKSNMITGIYSHDYIMHVFHRGKEIPLPRTVEALFSFAELGTITFLTIVERKREANFVANKLSEIIFGKIGEIVEARIPPETLREFHRKNPEDTKITFFDNVDIPNVNKLSLYGPDLINTSVFEDYLKHGDLWYMVVRSKETGYVVGITRDASVTIFNLSEKKEYVDYVSKEIYSLILGSLKSQ
jgi:hypothetical protein